jgi:hypothetical protein
LFFFSAWAILVNCANLIGLLEITDMYDLPWTSFCLDCWSYSNKYKL